MRNNYAYTQSTYKDWEIINKGHMQADISILKDLKMCLDGITKIEGFTTNEPLNITYIQLHFITITNCL